MSEQLVHHQHHTNTNIHKIILSDKEKTIMKKSKSVDNSALTYYESGFEKNRLRSNIGIIEFERTKEILLENLPNPPAVIYDIGGAYGEYSYWLASLERLEYIATHDEVSIVRIHTKGAIRATLSKTNKSQSNFALQREHKQYVLKPKSVTLFDTD